MGSLGAGILFVSPFNAFRSGGEFASGGSDGFGVTGSVPGVYPMSSLSSEGGSPVWMVRPHKLLASCILASVLCLACGGESKPHGRVLLVGIDGATLRVALPLLRNGKLPTLARIAHASRAR